MRIKKLMIMAENKRNKREQNSKVTENFTNHYGDFRQNPNSKENMQF